MVVLHKNKTKQTTPKKQYKTKTNQPKQTNKQKPRKQPTIFIMVHFTAGLVINIARHFTNELYFLIHHLKLKGLGKLN